MDEFYSKTVTVYNKTTAEDTSGTETWYATVLTNVRLLVAKGANIATSGLTSADSARLSIPLPAHYLQPVAWQKEENKAGFFTFTSGEDFFVEGDTHEEDTTQDDFFSYMKAKYDNCFKVTTCDKYDLIPHLEVGGN